MIVKRCVHPYRSFFYYGGWAIYVHWNLTFSHLLGEQKKEVGDFQTRVLCHILISANVWMTERQTDSISSVLMGRSDDTI